MDAFANLPTVWSQLAENMYLESSPTAEIKISEFSPYSFARVRSNTGISTPSRPIVGEQGYILIVQLRPICFIEEFLGRKRVSRGAYTVGSVSANNLGDEPSCFVPNPFDALVVNVTPATLNEIAYRHQKPKVDSLVWRQGTIDPVVAHLVQSLVAALESPSDASKLFVDHVLQAVNCHLVWSYGNGSQSAPIFRGGLAPWQRRRSTELLDAHIDGEITIQELADACSLSLGHFARAFRTTFGRPPHRWLMERRVDKAKDFIASSHLPLAEIAARCGFADQSSLSRSFKRIHGCSPGTWRRHNTRGFTGQGK
jgi:AraC family transcriptional regulator